jgi:hypothetical protein
MWFVYVNVPPNKHVLSETCGIGFVSFTNGILFCISYMVSHCVDV